MPKEVLADFEKETGITVKVQPQGDAGQLTNKLVLTKDSPLADGVYGIDNTFASRAVDEGVLSSYSSKALPASAADFELDGGGDKLTPVDFSDVCVNVDDAWFAEKKSRRRRRWTTSPTRRTRACSSPPVPRPPRRAWRSCSPPSAPRATAGRTTGRS